jgi:hypothetical protein
MTQQQIQDGVVEANVLIDEQKRVTAALDKVNSLL